jgi:diaminohydroxyphosphoribosylaminopyrimidine deaminase/5-amino-6-(5-phosphoribosylamino)uracil reductase
MRDHDYMRTALDLARVAAGQTGTNPTVGCVVVKDGSIIGLGAHLRQGDAHAEVHALNMAGQQAEGSTVYVTLEPCCHFGKTPPCVTRLIQAKVARVVVATYDPNPLVSGKGILQLRDHGIEVITGVLELEAQQLNEVFFHHIKQGRPFVAIKTANTLDGKIAVSNGDSQWITNDISRAFVHQLRHQYQAIMVGVGTVLSDNPRLTARGDDAPKRHPLRVVVDSQLRTPLDAKILLPRTDEQPNLIVLTTSSAPSPKKAFFEERGAEVIVCGDGPRVDLHLGLYALSSRNIASVLVEGGSTIHGALWIEQLVDKVYAFIAPKIIGMNGISSFNFPGSSTMDDIITLERVHIRTMGDDVLFVGYPGKKNNVR